MPDRAWIGLLALCLASRQAYRDINSVCVSAGPSLTSVASVFMKSTLKMIDIQHHGPQPCSKTAFMGTKHVVIVESHIA